MAENEMPQCEKCEQPATHAVRDFTMKRLGSGYIERWPMGPAHYFCDAHQRDAQQHEVVMTDPRDIASAQKLFNAEECAERENTPDEP